MDLSKILPVVETAAPTIAGLLGGPLASMGVSALEGVFGLAPGSAAQDPQSLERAVVGMTPEGALKLAQIDADLRAKLIQAGIDADKVAAADRDSARNRAIQQHDFSPIAIGALIVTIWAAINGYLLTAAHPPAIAPELVGRILGMIDATCMAFVYWLYGSSSGSGTKNQIIANLSGSR
jgi:hypothetical protein